MDAQAVATQLMVELCGARVAPGTDVDVGGRRRPGADRPTRRSGCATRA